MSLVDHFISPDPGPLATPGRVFLDPHNHEGIDLYRDPAVRSAYALDSARLVADGVCLWKGPVRGCSGGSQVIYAHHLPDGARLLSVYSHLAGLGNYQVGQLLPAGAQLGWLAPTVKRGQGEFLHFALAYGATWDTQLSRSPEVPLNAGPTWIEDRYLQPLAAMAAYQTTSPAPTADAPTMTPY